MMMLTITACGQPAQGDIDKDALAKIAGDYRVVAQESDVDEDYVGGWWFMSIGQFEGIADKKPYLTIYDCEAGNPGVEGPILELDGSQIKIDCSEYQDELPSAHWELDKNDVLTVQYQLTDSGIELTNNEFTIAFDRE